MPESAERQQAKGTGQRRGFKNLLPAQIEFVKALAVQNVPATKIAKLFSAEFLMPISDKSIIRLLLKFPPSPGWKPKRGSPAGLANGRIRKGRPRAESGLSQEQIDFLKIIAEQSLPSARMAGLYNDKFKTTLSDDSIRVLLHRLTNWQPRKGPQGGRAKERQIKTKWQTYICRGKYRYKHVLLWEEYHGRQVKKGHCIIFKDDNIENFALENLAEVSWGQMKFLKSKGYLKGDEFFKIGLTMYEITQRRAELSSRSAEARKSKMKGAV